MSSSRQAPSSHLGRFHRELAVFQNEAAQPFAVWTAVAVLHFIAQIIFRRELAPGEFGTLNTTLGMIGLMAVPMLALNRALAHYLARNHPGGNRERIDALRAGALLATETLAWIWCGISLLLVFLLLPLLDLPRFSLNLFTLLNVLIAVGGLLSRALCQEGNQLRWWAWLLVASALARVLFGWGLTWGAPRTESALAAFFLAGFITLAPALRSRETDSASRLKACRALWDGDFLLCLGATFSVLLALFLFSSADRIVAQSWFGVATNNNMGLVNWGMFDAYQTAGLLGRALLWGTQPLLWILFAQRSRLEHTTPASLTFFWIYLGALFAGAIFLDLLAGPLSRLFCGDDFQATSFFVPGLSTAMVPLGLLQALGVFSLASRRHHECFVLGGCSVGYTLLLYLVARQPQLMPAYMFGGGLVALMMMLFVGVVRWGRRQP
jgi:hypothetical protein